MEKLPNVNEKTSEEIKKAPVENLPNLPNLNEKIAEEIKDYVPDLVEGKSIFIAFFHDDSNQMCITDLIASSDKDRALDFAAYHNKSNCDCKEGKNFKGQPQVFELSLKRL